MQTVNFRNSLRGELEAFFEQTPFSKLIRTSALLDLVAGAMLSVEEGIQFSPTIYLCKSVADITSLAPSTAFFLLGQEKDSERCVTKTLKKGAPLSSRAWNLLIEVKPGSRFRYGLFCPSSSPITPDFRKVCLDQSDRPVIVISRHCDGVVDVRANEGKSLRLSLTHRDLTPAYLELHHARLAEKIISRYKKSPHKEALQRFVSSILENALKECHGALVCIVRGDRSMPKFLEDSVKLNPPVSFPSLVEDYFKEGEAEYKCALQTYYPLLKGIISLDGITVFSDDGRLLAYNAILSAATFSKKYQDIKGARSKAYKVLEDNVGKSLVCAFYRSQDGAMKMKS